MCPHLKILVYTNTNHSTYTIILLHKHTHMISDDINSGTRRYLSQPSNTSFSVQKQILRIFLGQLLSYFVWPLTFSQWNSIIIKWLLTCDVKRHNDVDDGYKNLIVCFIWAIRVENPFRIRNLGLYGLFVRRSYMGLRITSFGNRSTCPPIHPPYRQSYI
jgi:hypothetical protein